MMSRGQNPLIWMMAVTLPSAGHALGLGEIHVDSALNEPLAAEIDIVGATADELLGLRASVASRETFQHFGSDRPAFLNTATFKVTQDAKGRPVLSIRSSESFTETSGGLRGGHCAGSNWRVDPPVHPAAGPGRFPGGDARRSSPAGAGDPCPPARSGRDDHHGPDSCRDDCSRCDAGRRGFFGFG